MKFYYIQDLDVDDSILFRTKESAKKYIAKCNATSKKVLKEANIKIKDADTYEGRVALNKAGWDFRSYDEIQTLYIGKLSKENIFRALVKITGIVNNTIRDESET
jgi:nitrogen fixation protein